LKFLRLNNKNPKEKKNVRENGILGDVSLPIRASVVAGHVIPERCPKVDGDRVVSDGYQARAADRDDQLLVAVNQSPVGNGQRDTRVHVGHPDARHQDVFGVERDPTELGRHGRDDRDLHAARVRQPVQVGVHAQRVRHGRHAARQPVHARRRRAVSGHRAVICGQRGHRLEPVYRRRRRFKPVGHVRMVRRGGQVVQLAGRVTPHGDEDQNERNESVTSHRRISTDRRLRRPSQRHR